MIEENEIYPEIRIIPKEDVFEHDDDLLKKAINGLKSLEGKRIDEETRAELRTYKSWVEQAGYEYESNSTITDYVTTWHLKDVLDHYKKYYPERYVEKKEYTRIEVNNMLFDLHINGVIRGYSQVALPYSIAEDYNNEPFSEYKSIQVQII